MHLTSLNASDIMIYFLHHLLLQIMLQVILYILKHSKRFISHLTSHYDTLYKYITNFIYLPYLKNHKREINDLPFYSHLKQTNK